MTHPHFAAAMRAIAATVMLLATAATALAQQFHYLTAAELAIDSVLPRFACSIPLPANYADSTYTVSILYPEFIDTAPYSVKRLHKLVDDPLPELPVPEVNVVVERKKGKLEVTFHPFVFREGRHQTLVSFMLKVEASPVPAMHRTPSATGAVTGRYADNSVLASGKWVKIRVPSSGIYQLNDALVRQAGFSDLSKVRLYGYGGAMQNEQLLASVGLTREHFGEMVNPATVIGTLTPEVQTITGLGAVPVIAVAGHDTGSAVAAVPARDEQFAYLSSGTWSLMGIETKEAVINDKSFEYNFTNEGGIEGTTRFLKNICGMWLYERCRKEWTDAPKSHTELQAEAMKVKPFQSLINPDDAVFANPASMVDAIQDYCRQTGQHVPEGYAEICRCIFDSLALRYRQVFGWLKEFASFPIQTLHIIGGGSLNEYLDQFTANSTGVEVLAGPQEGTAIGNIMLQAKACGAVGDIWEMRKIIGQSIEMKRFVPQDKELWDAAYEHYLEVVR